MAFTADQRRQRGCDDAFDSSQQRPQPVDSKSLDAWDTDDGAADRSDCFRRGDQQTAKEHGLSVFRPYKNVCRNQPILGRYGAALSW